MRDAAVLAMLAAGALGLASQAPAADGSAARGQRVFGACAACHSLEPDRNMTGPSLSGLWHRKAGALQSFSRYSSALKSSGVVWDDNSLDPWIKDPQHFIPGNTMTFPGIADAGHRADLLAFLKEASQPGHAPSRAGNQGGGMMGMMGGAGSIPNLKNLQPNERVQKITHCGDSYRVTTVDGKSRVFWERNLRFKTDISDDGPQKGVPAVVSAGMMGDRADIIFAAPDEISGTISSEC